jgi:uncharacterized membrane protein
VRVFSCRREKEPDRIGASIIVVIWKSFAGKDDLRRLRLRDAETLIHAPVLNSFSGEHIRHPLNPRLWLVPLRWLAAGGFVWAGIAHFRDPAFYRRIIPPFFPARPALVAISGVCEIAGGLGLLVRPLRRAAGWGLIALLIAVFPANIYMALAPNESADGRFAGWMLWLRLPLQAVLIAWVWVIALGSLADTAATRLRSRQ